MVVREYTEPEGDAAQNLGQWRREWEEIPPFPFSEYDASDRAVDRLVVNLHLALDEEDEIREVLEHLRCLATDYHKWSVRAGKLLEHVEAQAQR